MKILAVDVGTGTQDIFLYDPRLDVENGYKMVLPAPTMITHRKLKQATRRGAPVFLTGVTMGGGPSQWAAEAHLRAGYAVYATPDAARSFNDDLDVVAEMGVQVVSQDEGQGLPDTVERLALRDFDFGAIARAFAEFDVSLDDLAAVAVAVFDHGNAPPDYSDRQFRFDYIAERVQVSRDLSAFAFMADDVPEIMTRMQSVVRSAGDVDVPLVLMDTAPAAVLGATLDGRARQRESLLVVNVGNFHTIAIRLGADGVEGVFEHHTGMLATDKLDGLLRQLADGSIRHEDVFNDHGHGALVFGKQPLDLATGEFGVVVTGPRQTMMHTSTLRPHFAAPFGDMMVAGCYGLLAALGDVLPDVGGMVRKSLNREHGSETAPWDVD